MTPRTAADYLRQPYQRCTRPQVDEDGTRYWIAEIREIPGVAVHAPEEIEARSLLEEAFEDYLVEMIELGAEIPPAHRPLRYDAEGDLVKDPTVDRVIAMEGEPTEDPDLPRTNASEQISVDLEPVAA